MVITQRHTEFLAACGLYVSLVLFDHNLYPHLGLGGAVVLATLRFFLLLIPLAIGYVLSRLHLQIGAKITLAIGWLLFLPYTIYSFAEIRHVAELCRLPVANYYTESCLPQLWTLLPVFIYAFAGSLIFIFSVSQVMNNLVQRSALKRLMILGICLYSALAATFGLYTRLNIWHLVAKPQEFFPAISALPVQEFLLNTIIISLFYIFILFVVNRVIRRAEAYISLKKS